MKKISIFRQLWCPSTKVASYDTIAETKMTYGYFSNLKSRSNIFQQSIKRKLLSWRLLLSRVTQCANKPTFKFYHRACQTVKCNLGVKNNANIYSVLYFIKKFFFTICNYHVTYEFQSESTLYSFPEGSRRHIRSLSDSKGIRTHNHIVRYWTLSNVAKPFGQFG